MKAIKKQPKKPASENNDIKFRSQIGKYHEIGEKKIWLRESFPLCEYSKLYGKISRFSLSDFDTVVEMATDLITDWEGFEGDPQNVESYQELDVFKEIAPLFRILDDHLSRLMTSPQKKAKESSLA